MHAIALFEFLECSRCMAALSQVVRRCGMKTGLSWQTMLLHSIPSASRFVGHAGSFLANAALARVALGCSLLVIGPSFWAEVSCRFLP